MTVRVANQVGMEAVAETAIAFHVVDNMPRVLPAALGAVETTVLREAGAYAALAAGGQRGDADADRHACRTATAHVVWRAPGLACDGLRRSGASRRS